MSTLPWIVNLNGGSAILIFCYYFSFSIFETGSLYYVVLAVLEPAMQTRELPDSASRILGLKMCYNTTRLLFLFFCPTYFLLKKKM